MLFCLSYENLKNELKRFLVTGYNYLGIFKAILDHWITSVYKRRDLGESFPVTFLFISPRSSNLLKMVKFYFIKIE